MMNRFIGEKVKRLKEKMCRVLDFPTFPPSHLPTSSQKGFTIIELLVAVGLFSVVVAIAVGGFARALRTQRQVELLLATNSNMGTILESVAREIRTGENFETTSGPGFKFLSARNEVVEYSLDNHRLMRKRGAAAAESISGDNVSVVRFEPVVSRTDKKDSYPPLITIVLGGAPNSTDPGIAGSIVSLQTTVSARLPDDNPAQLLVRTSVDNTKGGVSEAKDFTMAVVGYHVRPCTTPEVYVNSAPTPEEKKKRQDVVDSFSRPPVPPADRLGGVCRDMVKRTDNRDMCFFPGSLGGTWVAMAAGDYCVDENYSFYEKSFERDANTPSPPQAPESEGDCTKENNLSGESIDSIKVNQEKICVVKNK